MRVWLTAALLSSVLLGVAPAAHAQDPFEVSCAGLAPAAASASSAPAVDVDLLVTLDAVTPERAQALLEEIGAPYASAGVRLVPTFRDLTLAGSTDTQVLLEQVRAALGGHRPAGFDAVLALTSKDLTQGGSPSTAGQAYCVGGIARPDRAFAIAEVNDALEAGLLTAHPITDLIAAHELGHLFGLQHHYASCVEGVQSQPDDWTPCTLMTDRIFLAGMEFGTLERLVMRGYAEQYAAGP